MTIWQMQSVRDESTIVDHVFFLSAVLISNTSCGINACCDTVLTCGPSRYQPYGHEAFAGFFFSHRQHSKKKLSVLPTAIKEPL